MQQEFDNEDFYILQIIRTKGVTPKIFHNLINIFKTPKKVADYLVSFFNKHQSRNIQLSSEESIYKELNQIKKFGAKVITYKNLQYSRLLKLALDHPPVLICYGNIELLNSNCISVVGSRNASILGMNFTAQIARDLYSNGFTIVSGFAKGIDSSAHRAAIDKTIAVMPGGIDFIYPKENLLLYKDISEKGLILSEKPMFTEPDAIDFKTRNRIVAGLSVATCVMEATIKSGSLMTARLALEYDREVFAVPGQPADPRSRGTNQLLYNGAHMLTAINDVLEVLNSNINLIHTDHTVREDFIEVHINIDDITDEMRQTVKNSLSYEPVTIEALHTYTQVNIRFLHLILLEFELLQEIERHASNKFALPIRF